MTEELNKLEQLLKMLDGQLTKIKQSDDRLMIKKAYEMTVQLTQYRSDYATKKKWFLLEELHSKYNQLYFAELGDREEANIDGFTVSYKTPNPSFRLDQSKVRNYFEELKDEEYKNQFFSYTDPQKKLTIK